RARHPGDAGPPGTWSRPAPSWTHSPQRSREAPRACARRACPHLPWHSAVLSAKFKAVWARWHPTAVLARVAPARNPPIAAGLGAAGVPPPPGPGLSGSVPLVRPHYGTDVLAESQARRRRPESPQVEAASGLVVEEAGGRGFCGAVVACEKDAVTLEDRFGRRRVFPLRPSAFLLEGRPVTLTRPAPAQPGRPARSRSGSVARPAAPAGAAHRAQVARASRIYVEGRHDAELIEKIWGDDLRDV